MREEVRLEAAAGERLLGLTFRVSRDVVRTSTWSPQCWETLGDALTESPLLACPLLLLDVPPLLLGERLHPLSFVPVALRDALRRYEDDVLARLVSERRFSLLRDAVGSLPVKTRPLAMGLVLSQALSRLEAPLAVGLSLSTVRRCMAMEPGELSASTEAGLADVESVMLLSRLLQGTAQAARQVRALLNDADVFLASNAAALQQLASRVALEQVATAGQVLEEQLPRRLRLGDFDDGDAPTRLESESAYPVGGFSSITNVGTLENLVTSELMFMEDAGSTDTDMFDVRFAQNELLYYARDEAVAVRRQRVISLICDGSIAEARRKDAGSEFQRSVTGLALMTVMIRRLLASLSNEAIRFEVVFLPDANGALLQEEFDVTQLMLGTQVVRGQVTLTQGTTIESALRDAQRRHGVRGRQVVFAGRMPAGLNADLRPDGVVLLTGALPEVLWADLSHHAPAAETSLSRIAEALLKRLMKPGQLARQHRRGATPHSRTA